MAWLAVLRPIDFCMSGRLALQKTKKAKPVPCSSSTWSAPKPARVPGTETRGLANSEAPETEPPGSARRPPASFVIFMRILCAC
jgi:hypothetical protein